MRARGNKSFSLDFTVVQKHPKSAPPRVASRAHTITSFVHYKLRDKIRLTCKVTDLETDVSRLLHNDPAMHPGSSTITVLGDELPVRDRQTSRTSNDFVRRMALDVSNTSFNSSKCVVAKSLTGIRQRRKRIAAFSKPPCGAHCTHRSF